MMGGEALTEKLMDNTNFFFPIIGWDHVINPTTGLHVVHRLAETGISGLKQFLEAYPNLINLTDAKGHTPLHYAVMSGKIESMEMLLSIK
jgi:ankyrin repeat protein